MVVCKISDTCKCIFFTFLISHTILPVFVMIISAAAEYEYYALDNAL